MLLATNDGVTWRAVPAGAERFYALVVEVREAVPVKARRAPAGRPAQMDRLVEDIR